jgi:hypothetical protein
VNRVSCCGGKAPCNCVEWFCSADPKSSVPCLCQFGVRPSGTVGTSCVPAGSPLATPGGVSGGKHCCRVVGGGLGGCSCTDNECVPGNGEQAVAKCTADEAEPYNQCNLNSAASCGP